MIIILPIQKQITLAILFIIFLTFSVCAQSVLLVSSNTNVYDTYKEQKVVILKLEKDTWVNYKGKYGNFFKISNFFGKDEYYPNGIFEGYVNINSVLDTSTRKEYKSHISIKPVQNLDANHEQHLLQLETSPKSFEIEGYYLGMSQKDAISANSSSLQLSGHNYEIILHFNSLNILSSIEINGESEDAMAVDTSIKNQVYQLKKYITEKNGNPSESKNYPSFLELDDAKVNSVEIWDLPVKSIFLGIGEKDDLYYPSALFLKK